MEAPSKDPLGYKTRLMAVGVKLWQVADVLGIPQGTFYRVLAGTASLEEEKKQQLETLLMKLERPGASKEDVAMALEREEDIREGGVLGWLRKKSEHTTKKDGKKTLTFVCKDPDLVAFYQQVTRENRVFQVDLFESALRRYKDDLIETFKKRIEGSK